MTTLLKAAIAFGLLAVVSACGDDSRGVYQGYIEGDYLYISSPAGGKVEKLHIDKGAEVKEGDALYELDPEPELTSYQEAESRYHAAKAIYEDKTKGQRPTEIAAIEASVAKAEAELAFSEKELKRIKALREKEVTTEEKLDSAQAAFSRDKATVAELKEKLKTARMGARTDQVEAAEKEVQSAKAALDRAKWLLDEKKGFSPSAARVSDVLYRKGEYVPAGYPVVVLLPPDRVKARFFVPEPELSAIKTGRKVSVSIDGLKSPIEGTISFISPTAEYTPPFIYSKDSRAKLVFLVEASFSSDVARNLNPGQPVEVRVVQ